MHEASALLFRAVNSGGMGGVDVSTSGPSSAAISGLVDVHSVRGRKCTRVLICSLKRSNVCFSGAERLSLSKIKATFPLLFLEKRIRDPASGESQAT